MATVQTVLGPIAAEEMGFVLAHEHVMVDFIGAEETSPDRWDADEVVEVMAPYLLELVELGVRTFVDCTPAYIGRDVTVLQRLSQETGLHILSNTGWYKAPYLPARAFEQSAEEIAAEWIAEWEQGIDGTDVRPGLIKIAVNPGPLVPVQRTIVKAAALTSLTTGLTIAAHTGHGQAAMESLDNAEAAGLPLERYIVVHAQQIKDRVERLALAERGAWLEYDGINVGTAAWHADLVCEAIEEGFDGQVLLSHDAGWYSVGEPRGGSVRPFTTLFSDLMPLLEARGIGQGMIDKLCVANPARAFAIR